MADSFNQVTFDAVTPALNGCSLFWQVSGWFPFLDSSRPRIWCMVGISSLVQAAASGQTNIISSIASDVHRVKPDIYIQNTSYISFAFRLFFLFYRLSLSFGSGVKYPSLFTY